MPANKESTLPAVTVIGLGAMGSALAGAFLDAGHPTTVWNRSAGKGGALAARGAVLAGSAEEAVRAGELVVVCVLDHHAVREVVEPLAGVLRGRVLVNLTSGAPEQARETGAWAAGHSIAYLAGSVMVPTPMVGTPEALLFHAGSRDAFERYGSVLGTLGGRTEFVGEDPGLAAVYDLSLLDYFYGAMAGLVHAFALAGAHGVKAAEIAPHMHGITGIMAGIPEAAARDIDAGVYPGQEANLGMMATSVGHLLDVSRARGLDTGQLEAIKRVADRAIGRGHAPDDWSSTFEAVVRP
ncbi:NAD(P)-binding domain-containing protein [Streptomyces sp. CAU 1734]|uniref:NAD(P)-dependent oxidoreductase n=1 Tax=Streptomyces sp. CAU 1734 TaxID=3140360 RepID=UPI003261C7D2